VATVCRRAAIVASCAALAGVAGDSTSAGGVTGPVALAVTPGSVWVGLGTGEVLEVNTRTSQVRAKWPTGNPPYGFVHGLVVAGGALWVAAGNGIERIDPRTRRVRPWVPMRTPFTLAAGGGALWAARDGTNGLARVQLRRRRFETIRVPGRLVGVAAGGAGVVVVRAPQGDLTGPRSARVLQRVDPRTNRLTAAVVALECDQWLAVGARFVWTSDVCSGRLDRRDPRTLRSTASLVVGRDRRVVLAFGSVWLIGGGAVVRIDPGSMRVLARIPVRAYTAAADRSSLWLLDHGDGRTGFVRTLDPRTNRLVGREIRLAP
jgi:streptogramin lyase